MWPALARSYLYKFCRLLYSDRGEALRVCGLLNARWRAASQVNVVASAFILLPCRIPLDSSSTAEVRKRRAMNDLLPLELTAVMDSRSFRTGRRGDVRCNKTL
jgi:hypothetical protein